MFYLIIEFIQDVLKFLALFAGAFILWIIAGYVLMSLGFTGGGMAEICWGRVCS